MNLDNRLHTLPPISLSGVLMQANTLSLPGDNGPLPNEIELPDMQIIKNQLSWRNNEVNDQLNDQRKEYHIKFQFDLHKPLFWQNHEGTKLVALGHEVQEGNTKIAFKLFDDKF